MRVPTASPDATAAELRAQLKLALHAVYMSDSTFLIIFDQTPEQAIAAFRKSPEIFGKLRSYLGPTTLKKNMARVAKLAAHIHALSLPTSSLM